MVCRFAIPVVCQYLQRRLEHSLLRITQLTGQIICRFYDDGLKLLPTTA
jgi:hypothetical protein